MVESFDIELYGNSGNKKLWSIENFTFLQYELERRKGLSVNGLICGFAVGESHSFDWDFYKKTVGKIFFHNNGYEGSDLILRVNSKILDSKPFSDVASLNHEITAFVDVMESKEIHCLIEIDDI